MSKKLFWTPIDPIARPQSDFIQSKDGVKYNYLSATYDPESSVYSCTRNDYRLFDITPAEAQACMDKIQHTCDHVLPLLCEIDLPYLESLIQDADSGTLLLDQDQSCITNELEALSPTTLGIYSKDSTPKTKAGIEKSENRYFFDSDEASDLENVDQGTHCENLISSTCSNWKMTREVDKSCTDDPDFVLHGNIIQEDIEIVGDFVSGTHHDIKNCEWVVDNKRCGHKDRVTGKRAFEFCRKSCGYCNCSDNPEFRFNGQKDKDCSWVAQDSATRCLLEEVSDACITTCNTSCCKDDTDFLYKGKDGRDCEWVGNGDHNTWNKCKKKSIASQCPETCNKCSK